MLLGFGVMQSPTDIKALHQGCVLVLVQTGTLSEEDLVTALDGPRS